MAPGWDPLDIDGGDIAPMEAVMLDCGRTQPVSVDSTRSKTPALDAGRALAVALRVDPATVTVLPSGSDRRTRSRRCSRRRCSSGCARPVLDRLTEGFLKASPYSAFSNRSLLKRVFSSNGAPPRRTAPLVVEG